MEIVTLGVWVLTCALISWGDFRTKIIPNKLLAWSTALTLATATVVAFTKGSWETLFVGVSLSLASAVVFLVFALVSKNGFGMGDVKFAPLCYLLPAMSGLPTLLFAATLSFACAAVFGLLVMALQRGGLKTRIPFGPFMFFSSICSLLI